MNSLFSKLPLGRNSLIAVAAGVAASFCFASSALARLPDHIAIRNGNGELEQYDFEYRLQLSGAWQETFGIRIAASLRQQGQSGGSLEDVAARVGLSIEELQNAVENINAIVSRQGITEGKTLGEKRSVKSPQDALQAFFDLKSEHSSNLDTLAGHAPIGSKAQALLR